MAKLNTKTAQAMARSYYYGEVSYYAGSILRARKAVTP